MCRDHFDATRRRSIASLGQKDTALDQLSESLDPMDTSRGQMDEALCRPDRPCSTKTTSQHLDSTFAFHRNTTPNRIETKPNQW
jgi:hypothetical protein